MKAYCLPRMLIHFLAFQTIELVCAKYYLNAYPPRKDIVTVSSPNSYSGPKCVDLYHYIFKQLKKLAQKNYQGSPPQERMLSLCHPPIHILGQCHPWSPSLTAAFPSLPSKWCEKIYIFTYFTCIFKF